MITERKQIEIDNRRKFFAEVNRGWNGLTDEERILLCKASEIGGDSLDTIRIAYLRSSVAERAGIISGIRGIIMERRIASVY